MAAGARDFGVREDFPYKFKELARIFELGRIFLRNLGSWGGFGS